MSPMCRSLYSYSGLPSLNRRLSLDLSLYLVANRPSYPDEDLFISKIMNAVKGGVSCVQLRDHQSDLDKTIQTTLRLKNMLKGTPLFVNTLKPFEVAEAVEAEGIYLEDKFSPSEARNRLGPEVIIGIPVKTIEDVLAVQGTNEIDYLSVKIYASKKTCSKNDQLWEMDGLRKVRAISRHRIVAIGGLNLECVESVYRELHVDDGIAMAGGLMDEASPSSTAQKIQAIRQKVKVML